MIFNLFNAKNSLIIDISSSDISVALVGKGGELDFFSKKLVDKQFKKHFDLSKIHPEKIADIKMGLEKHYLLSGKPNEVYIFVHNPISRIEARKKLFKYDKNIKLTLPFIKKQLCKSLNGKENLFWLHKIFVNGYELTNPQKIKTDLFELIYYEIKITQNTKSNIKDLLSALSFKGEVYILPFSLSAFLTAENYSKSSSYLLFDIQYDGVQIIYVKNNVIDITMFIPLPIRAILENMAKELETSTSAIITKMNLLSDDKLLPHERNVIKESLKKAESKIKNSIKDAMVLLKKHIGRLPRQIYLYSDKSLFIFFKELLSSLPSNELTFTDHPFNISYPHFDLVDFEHKDVKTAMEIKFIHITNKDNFVNCDNI